MTAVATPTTTNGISIDDVSPIDYLYRKFDVSIL